MSYTFSSRVRYSETDEKLVLTPEALVNYLQDTSIFHSESLGYGVEYLNQQHQAWMLTFWQIVIEDMPRLNDEIEVTTWPYEFKGLFGLRNFTVTGQNGEKVLAYANSGWVLMDMDKQRPMRVSREMAERFGVADPYPMEYAPRKISVPDGGRAGEVIVISQQHLDSNHHVNNGQYIRFGLELLPPDVKLRQIRVEYKAQAHLGDHIYPVITEAEDTVTVALNDETGSPYAVAAFKLA